MKEEKTKKKFNKKLLTFGIIGLFAMALVTGALLTYYGQIQQNVNVEQAVVLSDNKGTINSIFTEGSKDEFTDGSLTLVSDVYSVKNVDPEKSRDVELVTICRADDNGDGNYNKNCANEITTSYVGVLELTTKDGAWNDIDDRKATVEYSIIGDVFTYEIIEGAGTLGLEDYKLIYYIDNPHSVSDEERMNTMGTVLVIVNGTSIGSLPMAEDWNAGEKADYCTHEPDMYEHCKGAKLWLVPSEYAIDGLLKDWNSWTTFLYETDLIVYSVDDVITLPAGGGFDFMVENTFAGTGDYTITTEVLPA